MNTDGFDRIYRLLYEVYSLQLTKDN